MGAIDLKALNREKNIVIAADMEFEGGMKLLDQIMPDLISRKATAIALLTVKDPKVLEMLNYDFDHQQAMLMVTLGLMDEPKKSE